MARKEAIVDRNETDGTEKRKAGKRSIFIDETVVLPFGYYPNRRFPEVTAHTSDPHPAHPPADMLFTCHKPETIITSQTPLPCNCV
jgi:hypothetical protein